MQKSGVAVKIRKIALQLIIIELKCVAEAHIFVRCNSVSDCSSMSVGTGIDLIVSITLIPGKSQSYGSQISQRYGQRPGIPEVRIARCRHRREIHFPLVSPDPIAPENSYVSRRPRPAGFKLRHALPVHV